MVDQLPEDERRASLFQDPFSDVTRKRQGYLLISSLLTLACTFSQFHITKFFGIEGTANISNKTLAWLFVSAAVYLLMLFLGGAAQELKSHNLRCRFVFREYREYMKRRGKHTNLWIAARKVKWRRYNREIGINNAIRDSEDRTRKFWRHLPETLAPLNKELEELVSTEPSDEIALADARTRAEVCIARIVALSKIPNEERLLRNQKRAELGSVRNSPESVEDNALLQSLQERMAELWIEADEEKLSELEKLQTSASRLNQFRVAVEVVLPVLFSVASIAIRIIATRIA